MYAIAGATGRTGAAVVEALLAKGERVRVIVRDTARGEQWRARGAEVAVADLRDATGLAAALRGALGAYLLVPTEVTVADLAAAQRSFIGGISGALEESRIPHVVLLSSWGAELPACTGPVRGLHVAEQALRSLPGTDATLLRAVYFMENFASSLGMLDKGLLPTFVPEDLGIPMVATRDLGVVAARLLTEAPRGTRVVYATGPARYGYADAARILTRLLGREIRAERAPIEAMVPALTAAGFSPGVATAYREMTEALTEGRFQIPPEAEQQSGMISLEAVLRDLTLSLAPILPA